MTPIVARTLVIGTFNWVGQHLRIHSEIICTRLSPKNTLWAQVVVNILRLPVRTGIR